MTTILCSPATSPTHRRRGLRARRACWLLLAAVALFVACSDDSEPTKPGDAALADKGIKPGDAALADTGIKADGMVVDGGSPRPATCAAKPSGNCDPATAPPCVIGGELCRCLSHCGGAQLPPGSETQWLCLPELAAGCPATAPTQGASCPTSGLVCKYPTCTVTTATCTNGSWQVDGGQPPP